MPDRDQTRTIFEIAKILVSEHELEALVPRLLAYLIETLPAADAGMLMLYDPVADRLFPGAAQGYDLQRIQAMRLAPGESMSGKALETGTPQFYKTSEAVAQAMSDLAPTNRAILHAVHPKATQPQSAICLPLIANTVKVGVLLLENLAQPASFTDEEFAFLQPIADLLALAIENVRLREELEDVRSLDEANRLKAEVISTLAHEMRTPLTSIKGYASALLMEEASFSPETQREFLKFIDEDCDVLRDLIHDLLESSMIDAGFLRLEMQPVRLPHLARAATEDFVHLSSHHRFLVDFAPDFPLVEADPQRITQVLRNLIDNAVKYSPDGSLVVVRGETRNGEAIVSVADQGMGIAPEHVSRLFEKFFRIKSGLGRHVVGTGLGLPIARAIVESHGGRIWAESQLGQGTTMFFTLPLRPLVSPAED